MKKVLKWIENYWYHYKGLTLIALFVAAVLVVGVTQCVKKEDYDYLVMLRMKRYVPEQVIEVTEDYLEQYASDINGDGEVTVRIMDVSVYSGQDAGFEQAASEKLQAEALRGEVMIYIVDDSSYDTINSHIAEFDKRDYFPDKNGTAYNLKDSELADSINSACESDYVAGNLYITKRMYNGNNDTYIQNEKNADDLLRRMVADLEKG